MPMKEGWQCASLTVEPAIVALFSVFYCIIFSSLENLPRTVVPFYKKRKIKVKWAFLAHH